MNNRILSLSLMKELQIYVQENILSAEKVKELILSYQKTGDATGLLKILDECPMKMDQVHKRIVTILKKGGSEQ